MEFGRTDDASYDRLAPLYDLHLGQFSQRLGPVLEKLLLHRLPSGARILDVCCGTGQLAALLCDKGFATTGVDLSREMLKFARVNAPSAEFVTGAASAFDLGYQVQAALSTFDSINHILDADELTASFQNIARHLENGGWFLFDMNMAEGYQCRWHGNWRGSDGYKEYRIEARYDPDNGRAHNVIGISDHGCTATWHITERCYSEVEVCEAIAQAGFGEIEIFDGHRDLDLFGELGRSFFLCRKLVQGSGTNLLEDNTVKTNSEISGAGCKRSDMPVNKVLPGKRQTLPPAEVVRELGDNCRRLDAISEVLAALPDSAYQCFQDYGIDLLWIIPRNDVLGQVRAIPGGEKRIIYLSPQLETCHQDLVFVTVAHEIAHVILNHTLENLTTAEYERQEAEVHDTLVAWGFGSVSASAGSHLSLV